jgi:ABC-type transporter Mla MlaB component
MVAAIDTAEAGRPVFRVVERPAARGLTWACAQDDLDLLTLPAARVELARLLRGAPRCLLVYVGADRFVDVGGLRLLVDSAEQARRRGGDLTVVEPPYCLRLMVGLFDLGDQLRLAPTPIQAVRWSRSRRG